MRIFIIIFFILFTSTTQAQNSKRIVKYRKLTFEHKEVFLLDKIERAKNNKDYESLEEWELELKKLRAFNNFSSEEVLKNGFFIDALIGLGLYSLKLNGSQNTFSFNLVPSIRFGNKWYFSKSDKSLLGINLIYLRPTVFVTNAQNLNLVSYSILNFGLTGFKLWKNEKSGLEFSFNTGYNMLTDVQFDTEIFHGVNINPAINFRSRKLNFGIDLLSTYYPSSTNNLFFNVLSFNFGAKF